MVLQGLAYQPKKMIWFLPMFLKKFLRQGFAVVLQCGKTDRIILNHKKCYNVNFLETKGHYIYLKAFLRLVTIQKKNSFTCLPCISQACFDNMYTGNVSILEHYT